MVTNFLIFDFLSVSTLLTNKYIHSLFQAQRDRNTIHGRDYHWIITSCFAKIEYVTVYGQRTRRGYAAIRIQLNIIQFTLVDLSINGYGGCAGDSVRWGVHDIRNNRNIGAFQCV